ncbi:Centrosomal protein of 131 kDa [Gonapodya sp. JEL0774]|nr:Centrosomal protein of 131 kDa [Gonapodya sp. JEL0774]
MIPSKKDLKSKLALQRKEYEAVVRRHLALCDRLVKEKEEIARKCEQMGDEVKAVEKEFREKTKSLQDLNARELKQQRELWAAAEKVRRDKWAQERTKAIKDQTIKGLEPEIQRMLAQHKMQLRQMEENYKDDLQKEKATMNENHQRQIEQLLHRINIERQSAAEQEREFARQRYQKQLERDEMEFSQQKRKLVAELEERKELSLAQVKEERRRDMEEVSKREAALRRAVETERERGEQALEEMKRRSAVEMGQLKERMVVEKEEWQERYMNKVETEMRAREKLFKEKLIQERDAEIELVIQRIESESSSNSSESTRRQRLEMERFRAENAEEVKQVRDAHAAAVEKVLTLERDLREMTTKEEDARRKVMKLETAGVARENLLRQQKTELSRLRVDEETLSENIRQGFQHQLTQKDSTIESLREDLTALRTQLEVERCKYQQELEVASNQKENTLSLVETRVKKALGAKDEVIASLRAQVEELTIRCQNLERLIEKQRVELLGS